MPYKGTNTTYEKGSGSQGGYASTPSNLLSRQHSVKLFLLPTANCIAVGGWVALFVGVVAVTTVKVIVAMSAAPEEEEPAEAEKRRRSDRIRHRPNVRFASAACRRRHVDSNGYTWGCASAHADHWPHYLKLPKFGTTVSGEPNVCRHCKALLFSGEESNECCMHGAVQVDPLPAAPEVVQFLCDPDNPLPAAKHFREHAIQYNTAVSFGSLSTERQMPPGRGPPVVMLNGQQSQQIGNVRPGFNEHGQRKDPLFGQVYLLSDIDEAVNARMRGTASQQQLSASVLRMLEQMIRGVNPFAQRLLSLGQTLAAAQESGTSVQNFILSILDHRPAPGQVCAFFESSGEDPPDPSLSGIWIRTEGNRLKLIDIWNRNADWLIFSVMFPRATQTYGRGIPRHSLRRIQDSSVNTCNEEEFLEMVADEADDGAELPDSGTTATDTVDDAGAVDDPPAETQPL